MAMTEGLQAGGFAAGSVLTRPLFELQACNPPVGSADSPLCTRGPPEGAYRNRRTADAKPQSNGGMGSSRPTACPVMLSGL